MCIIQTILSSTLYELYSAESQFDLLERTLQIRHDSVGHSVAGDKFETLERIILRHDRTGRRYIDQMRIAERGKHFYMEMFWLGKTMFSAQHIIITVLCTAPRA